MAADPTGSSVPTPLFPAYSSQIPDQKDNPDWLSNSSFSEFAHQQVFEILNKKNDVEKVVEQVKTEHEQVKKRKTHHVKQKKYADSVSFDVSKEESILNQLKRKTFIEETGLSYERAYCVDSDRDQENLFYESFERSKISSYKPCLLFPLGLSNKELASWSSNLPKKNVKRTERYFSRSFCKSLNNATFEKVSTKKNSNDEHFEYLSIASDQDRTFRNENLTRFLNVSSSWKLEKGEKENFTEKPSVEDLIDTTESSKEKVIYYNKKLSENPFDILTWLEFVDFQNEIVMCKEGQSNPNVLTEKKIAILDKALKHNPKDPKLTLKKLELSRELHESEKLLSLYEKLILENPQDRIIWQSYFDFVLSNLENFNLITLLNLHAKCLKIFAGFHSSDVNLPYALSIFHQLCDILKLCGYVEKGTALYQALLELNLFCDVQLKKSSINERVACFEPFWDSGAPRIGEKGAIGWNDTLRLKKLSFDFISTDSDLNNMEDDILQKKLSLSKTWLEFENLRETHHWLPWRPNPEYDQTEDDIDDPERIIAFSDISKFLFSVDDEQSLFLLLLDFVAYLGFDVHLFSCLKRTNSCISVANYENITKELNIPLDKNPLHFRTSFWSEEKISFVENVLLQASNKFSQKYKTFISCMRLKFKRHCCSQIQKESLKSLKKVAKNVLKAPENRNSLLLWLEYINLEWEIDNQQALKTFYSLLASSLHASSSGSLQLGELIYFVSHIFDLVTAYSTKFKCELLPAKEMLWVLFLVANKENYVPYQGQEITSLLILKTVNAFKKISTNELSRFGKGNVLCSCVDPYQYSFISCTKCFAYFQYYSKGIETSVEVYKSAISQIESNSASDWREYLTRVLYEAQSNLLNYHTWSTSVSVRPLQAFLCESLQHCPDSGYLLSLFVKIKSASAVISPTRRFLAKILKKSDQSHPVTWIFVLAAEFAIAQSLSLQNDSPNKDDYISTLGINWKIRSLYEQMLKSHPCSHIPLLWRSYLKFEIMMQEYERAKSVFHRALPNCGWSKELLKDGITYFPDQMNRILELMNEKQVRIHTPLEEIKILMEHAVDDN